MPRIPRRWQCPRHGAPIAFGCKWCEPIASTLIEIVGRKQAKTAAQLRLAADLVIRYAAGAPGPAAVLALALAANLYLSAVPGPTRRKVAA